MLKAMPNRIEAVACALALIVFVVGVVLFLVLPVLGWVAGPVLCILAFPIALRSEKVCRCTECRAIVPRG